MKHRTADYGLDAPGVVRNLLLMGAVGLVLAAAGLLVRSVPVIMLGISGRWIAAAGLIEAAYMAWSSRRGKLLLRERVLDGLRLSGSEQVLDVGCGRGLFLNGAARRLTTGRAAGLDLWQKEDQSGNHPDVTLANASAEGVADRVEVHTGDMRRMPFPDAVFDVVLSSIALHNIPDAEGREAAVREIDRVLKPGGRIALVDFRHTARYAKTLRDLGWDRVAVSSPSFLMFPPVRAVTGSKPIRRTDP